jgi:hypothetical protein
VRRCGVCEKEYLVLGELEESYVNNGDQQGSQIFPQGGCRSRVVTRMTSCRECRYYVPIDGSWGDCFGYEVPGDRDGRECPFHAFAVKPDIDVLKARISTF